MDKTPPTRDITPEQGSDRFYLIPTLLSSSLGITPDRSGDTPWLKFRYALTVSESENSIGELNLSLNDSLEIIDENWLIDIHSPYVISV
jgi:hypothetical protein